MPRQRLLERPDRQLGGAALALSVLRGQLNLLVGVAPDLLAFDGRVHHLEEGSWLKFEIKRVEAKASRPHGLSYSFTLHDPAGRRLVGFDNAHLPKRGASAKKATAADHWHRTVEDPGRPYEFVDVPTLIDDFFDEVERVLRGRGVSSHVVRVERERRSK